MPVRPIRITVGCRVKGSHGDLIPNPRGHSRRIREKIVGTVVSSVGHAKWMVRFDVDGVEKCCAATTLTVVDEAVGRPLEEIASENKAEFPAEDPEDADEEDNIPNGDWDLAEEIIC